jgi:hypothetical protein
VNPWKSHNTTKRCLKKLRWCRGLVHHRHEERKPSRDVFFCTNSDKMEGHNQEG